MLADRVRVVGADQRRIFFDAKQEMRRNQHRLQGETESLFKGIAALLSHRDQADQPVDLFCGHRTAESPMSQTLDNLALTPGEVIAVEVSAGVDIFETFRRSPFSLRVRTADFQSRDAGFIDGDLFGSAGFKILSEFL